MGECARARAASQRLPIADVQRYPGCGRAWRPTPAAEQIMLSLSPAKAPSTVSRIESAGSEAFGFDDSFQEEEGDYEAIDVPAWLHGMMKRVTAEKLLKAAGVVQGSFLVRESETLKNDFTLSVRNGDRAIHFRIARDTVKGLCTLKVLKPATVFLIPSGQ